MRNVCLRALLLAVSVIGILGVARETKAQNVQTLIDLTNTVWKYDQSGTELGTIWRTNAPAYNDSAWPSGKGLLGFDNGPAYPLPTTTVLNLSDTLVTYYFRTTFTYSGTTNGVSLIASNYIDDGAVIYLNGMEIGRYRVAAGQNSTTRAGTGNTEGAFDVLQNISPGLLRQSPNLNLIAVEVHQGATPATDITWGMRLIAIVPTALTITNHPVSDTIAVGDTITLTAGVSGGPVYYQWQKDGVNISNGGNVSGANTNALRIVNAQLNNAGTYRLVVTNQVTPFLASSPAVLTVVDDTTGPTLVSAVIRDTGATNQIVVQFSEAVQSGLLPNSTSTNLANYRITQCGTANTVTITNATQGGSQVQLRVSGPNWNPTNCYYLTVTVVADSRGNQINPYSNIPISFPITTNMSQMSDFWTFNANAALEDAFLDNLYSSNFVTQAWTKTNFVESALWGFGRGIFVFDPDATAQLCAGDGFGDAISYQDDPTLFRRTFLLETNFGTTGTLRLRYFVDDGMILYLNGKEVHRYNMPGTLGSPYTVTTRASASVNASCITNVSIVVSNLFPRTNWLAAAVFQFSTDGSSDTVFGLEMDGVFNKSGTVPLNATNRPTIVRTLQRTPQATNHVLSWPTTHYGYALRYSTNIVGRTPTEISNWFKSDTHWIQVKDQSNPYSNAIPPTTGPRRFYQLFNESPRN